jgi:LuxR family transcriptional regulator, maltose regulon positive regulatory protein
MTVWIVSAKLNKPAMQENMISRMALISRLTKGITRRLTLVSAPAGFGKTTLVNSWLTNPPGAVAWLSLDKADNYSNRFLTYLISALSRVDASIGKGALEMLALNEQPPVETILNDLLHDIEAAKQGMILVFEDYQLIQNPVIHESVTYLIQNMPGWQMDAGGRTRGGHSVVITRSDPPFPLSRWRLHNELMELHSQDLRFSEAEVSEFFNRAAGLHLTAEQITTLHQKTEGWVAGLQLAVLSMRNQSQVTINQFIHDFSGGNALVVDYLIEEVIDQQPREIQSFLMETSILEHLSGPLCDAVCARPDSQSILELLERTNLFVIPLDDHRGWYRYHQLFLDVLINRRKTLPSERMNLLHTRAAAWYEQNRFTEHALRYWLKAGEVDRAARFMTEMAPQLLSDGQFFFLHDAFEAFPQDTYDRWPWLSVFRAWTLHLLKSEPVENWLSKADRTVEAQRSSFCIPELKKIQGEILALRTLCAADGGDPGATFILAPQALELLPAEPTKVRGLVFFAIGTASISEGRFDEALNAYLQAGSDLQQGGNLGGAADAFDLAGEVLISQGKLRAALRVFQNTIQAGENGSNQRAIIVGTSWTGAGEVYFEWNLLDEAFRYLREGGERCSRFGLSMQVTASIALANAYIGCGDLRHGEEILSKFDFIHNQRSLRPYMLSKWSASWLRLFSKQGSGDRANQWIEERGIPSEPPFDPNREIESMALANHYLAVGDFAAAARLSSQLEQYLGRVGQTGWQVKMLALQAIAEKMQGNFSSSIQMIQNALQKAAPEGYIRSFIEFGDPMLELIVEMQQAERIGDSPAIGQSYMNKLLNSFLASNLEKPQSTRTVRETSKKAKIILRSDALLTPQEEKILRLMVAGNTAPEIAFELALSINTVKTHVNNIFNKLGVHNRLQAVNRARLLNLV